MTPAEAAALLAIAAAFDNRKPDADAATAWAAALHGFRFEDCREAVIQHFRASSDWLMPAAVAAGVRRIRNDRVRAFGPYNVPSGLEAGEYHALIRATTRRIADGDLTDPAEIALPSGDPRSAIEWAGMFRSMDDIEDGS